MKTFNYKITGEETQLTENLKILARAWGWKELVTPEMASVDDTLVIGTPADTTAEQHIKNFLDNQIKSAILKEVTENAKKEMEKQIQKQINESLGSINSEIIEE